MLAQLELKNFRCFQHHRIEFHGDTLLVGKNNAGKSTVIEALRLVSLVTERINGLALKNVPEGFDLPARLKGFSPSLESIAVHKECLFHRYGDPPALVSATFSNGSRMDVHIGDGLTLHAVVYNAKRVPASTRSAVEEAGIPRVSILPQIGPVAEIESKLNEQYVKSNVQTIRSSLHFRNQLKILYKEYFESFKNLVTATWPGLSITSLDLPGLMDKEGRISLMVRDGDFSAEMAWMGHGLQMWLQTMWFLSRNQQSAVLILDEPDVYMHADLQRKLIRMLMRDNRQFIIATHSPEMLAEVDPDAVVVLNRRNRVSKPATSSSAIQELLRHVGSVHNISLARLGTYGRILLVEGEDLPILKLFQNAVDPRSAVPIDALPNSDIGGWSKWPSVITLANFFRHNTSDRIQIFCVLDRDFHTEDEIQRRMAEARSAGVHLHIWTYKEIENYALSAPAIARAITKEGKSTVAIDDVELAIKSFADEMKEETFDNYSELIRQQGKQGANKSNPAARRIVNERWTELGGPAVVNGKQLFSRVAKWSHDEHGVMLNLRKVIREMRQDEVTTEMAEFIRLVTNQG
jgi:hypothetical protein